MLYCNSATQQSEERIVAFGGRDVEKSKTCCFGQSTTYQPQPHRADAPKADPPGNDTLRYNHIRISLKHPFDPPLGLQCLACILEALRTVAANFSYGAIGTARSSTPAAKDFQSMPTLPSIEKPLLASWGIH